MCVYMLLCANICRVLCVWVCSYNPNAFLLALGSICLTFFLFRGCVGISRCGWCCWSWTWRRIGYVGSNIKTRGVGRVRRSAHGCRCVCASTRICWSVADGKWYVGREIRQRLRVDTWLQCVGINITSGGRCVPFVDQRTALSPKPVTAGSVRTCMSIAMCGITYNVFGFYWLWTYHRPLASVFSSQLRRTMVVITKSTTMHDHDIFSNIMMMVIAKYTSLTNYNDVAFFQTQEAIQRSILWLMNRTVIQCSMNLIQKVNKIDRLWSHPWCNSGRTHLATPHPMGVAVLAHTSGSQKWDPSVHLFGSSSSRTNLSGWHGM